MGRNNHTYVNRTRVGKNDIMSLDGVIHTINKVFLPPMRSVWDAMRESSKLGYTLKAFVHAKLKKMLQYGNDITVFAPRRVSFDRRITQRSVSVTTSPYFQRIQSIMECHIATEPIT